MSYTLLNQQEDVSVGPVVALPMEQGFGVAVQRLHWVVGIVTLLSVIESHKEGCLFNGVQRLLVLAAAEVGVTALCPRRPAEWKRTESLGLTLCCEQYTSNKI